MDAPTIFFIQLILSTIGFTILATYLTFKKTYVYKPGSLFYLFYVMIAAWAWLNLLASLKIFLEYASALSKLAVIIGEIGILLFAMFLADVHPTRLARLMIPVEIIALGFLIYSNIASEFYVVEENELLVFFPPQYTMLGALVFFIYLILAIVLINATLVMMYRGAAKPESKKAIKLFLVGFNIAYIGTIVGIILFLSGFVITVFTFVGIGAIIIALGYRTQPTIIYLIPNSLLAVLIVDNKSGLEVWSYSKIDIDTVLTSGLVTALVRFSEATLKITSDILIFEIPEAITLMLYKTENLAGLVIAKNKSQFLVSKLKAFIVELERIYGELVEAGVVIIEDETRGTIEKLFLKHWEDLLY